MNRIKLSDEDRKSTLEVNFTSKSPFHIFEVPLCNTLAKSPTPGYIICSENINGTMGR